MKVVVIGGTGNVGTSTLRALAADPQVTSLTGTARRKPDLEIEKTTWAAADVRTDDLTPLLRGADAVVHLAWLFQPTRRPEVTWGANVLGSARVFQAVADAQVPALVYASSVGAYSPGPKDRPVDESWPTHGWSEAAYSREKAYVERLLDRFEADHPNCRVVRMRPGFIFARHAATAQRRLFGGPLVPGRLVRDSLIPFVPDIAGLRFQALHSADAGAAFHQAVVRDVQGPFNLAADPVLDPDELASLLGARKVKVPVPAARAALAAAWLAHAIPASPYLFDLVLRVPLMDSSRARDELDWSPRHTSRDALSELFAGLNQGADEATPALSGQSSGRLRVKEFLSGVGRAP